MTEKSKVSYRGFEPGAVEMKITAASESAVNTALKNIAEDLRNEVPVRTGAARDSITVVPAQKIGTGFRGWISLGKDLPGNYIFKVLKGSKEQESHHYAGPKVMAFEDWPDGPPELRDPKTGLFFFKKVKHKIPENDFVNRVMTRYGVDTFKGYFAAKIKDIFGRM